MSRTDVQHFHSAHIRPEQWEALIAYLNEEYSVNGGIHESLNSSQKMFVSAWIFKDEHG